MSKPSCIADCDTHPDRLCDIDPGHDGRHECADCPGPRRARRTQMIDDKIAAHRMAEAIETAPDVD